MIVTLPTGNMFMMCSKIKKARYKNKLRLFPVYRKTFFFEFICRKEKQNINPNAKKNSS